MDSFGAADSGERGRLGLAKVTNHYRLAREAGARVGAFGEDREGIDLLIAGAPDLYADFEPILAPLFTQFMSSQER